MPGTRLVLLEGIPGSGKSTAGTALQRFLEDQGYRSTFWHEGDLDHPADFEGVAGLTEMQVRDLLARYPDLASFIEGQLTVRGGDYLLKYRKLQHLHPQQVPQELVDELACYDVYDGLPMENYCRLARQRWQDFVKAAETSAEITILECCFLQNPLTVMLARHNADPETARRQVTAIARILEPLTPLVVYLSPGDVRAALLHVQAERPREWADFVTWYLTGQAYGQANQLSGYEGVIRFYEMRQKLEVELLDRLPIRSKVIEQTGSDWERSRVELIGFVSRNLTR